MKEIPIQIGNKLPRSAGYLHRLFYELSPFTKEIFMNLFFQGAKNKYNSMTNFDGISNHPALQNKDLLKEIAGEETLIM